MKLIRREIKMMRLRKSWNESERLKRKKRLNKMKNGIRSKVIKIRIKYSKVRKTTKKIMKIMRRRKIHRPTIKTRIKM